MYVHIFKKLREFDFPVRISNLISRNFSEFFGNDLQCTVLFRVAEIEILLLEQKGAISYYANNLSRYLDSLLANSETDFCTTQNNMLFSS